MRRAIIVALGTGAIITIGATIGIGAAVTTAPVTMTRVEYAAAMAGVESARPRRMALCEELSSAERELCRTEANAAEMVQVAEIEESFRRTPGAAREAQRARIDARYQVARARCLLEGGLKRDQCLIQVHATRGRALMETQAPYESRNG